MIIQRIFYNPLYQAYAIQVAVSSNINRTDIVAKIRAVIEKRVEPTEKSRGMRVDSQNSRFLDAIA